MATEGMLSGPIKLEFAVDMTCDHCASAVRSALDKVSGISSLDISVPDKRVLVEGRAAPSRVLSAILGSGRAAVLRGQDSGAAQHLGAAVCIFEHYPDYEGGWAQYNNRGLARMVQIDQAHCLVDVSVGPGLAPGVYDIAVHEFGDISEGSSSTGPAMPRGSVGKIEVGHDGTGQFVGEMTTMAVWDMIGRSMVLQRSDGTQGKRDAICGVIARSAGAFQNTKVVCSCSGQTLWQEAAPSL
ncbi:superoxide dismutase [Hyaloraphidium curvatum]|nr:superoxide dismutase [Hyaloraphidium curvatum]